LKGKSEMYDLKLTPCYLDSLFLRGAGLTVSDGAMSRIASLALLDEALDEHEFRDELGPYVGALFLLALRPFCATRDYNHEPAELMPTIIRSLSPPLERKAHVIADSWGKSCPKDYVLLPEHVLTVAHRIQADTWEREIGRFRTASIRGVPFFDEIIDRDSRIERENRINKWRIA